jgi:subtilisin family serine protease
VLFVAAAGNFGQDNDVFPNYPSNYDVPNVIAVAATDRFDRMAFFSNFGATTVDLAAPGVDVYSTFPGGSYGTLSGTSMATPHVSGALALILGRFPTMSGADAKALLLSKVDTLSSLTGKVATGGRLNAFWPIAEPDSVAPGMVSSLQALAPNGTRVTLRWTATGDDGSTGTASRYEVRYSTAPITEANFESALHATGAPRPAAAGSQEEMRVTGLNFLTTYYFALKAFDEFGNASPLSNVPSATTLGPPDIAVTPTSIHADLLTGGTTTASRSSPTPASPN